MVDVIIFTSRHTVQLLRLPVQPLPAPCRIRWIKVVDSIKVIKHCELPSQNKDEIVCDLVKMDACHLLFGRPWQSDLNAQNKGREDIYCLIRFLKDGTKSL